MDQHLLAGVLAVALAAAACDSGPAKPREASESLAFRAFAGVPLMPGALIGDVRGEGQAAQASLHLRYPTDSVATWYRRALLQRHWTIVNDMRTSGGVINLHARDSNHRSIWLLISSEGSGTVVTVVGAVPEAGKDTT